MQSIKRSRLRAAVHATIISTLESRNETAGAKIARFPSAEAKAHGTVERHRWLALLKGERKDANL